MSRRALLISALALAAACHSGSGSPSLRLLQPSAAALFNGYTDRHVGEVRPYVAIASSGNDELVLLDPVDDAAVASTIGIRPLSIPLPDPRPALVAGASLGDGVRPDLLVAISAGSTDLQLVRTWTTGGVSAPEVDDVVAPLGRPVQAMVAVPAVSSGGEVIPGQAWVIAALAPASGQGTDLAVVTYARTPITDPPTQAQPDAIAANVTAIAVQHLAFEVRSLGVDPADPHFVYAASGDPIPDVGGVLGVAELSLSGGPGSFGVRGLDARAATTLVAGFTLAERNVDQTGSYDQIETLLTDDACALLGTSCGKEGFRHGDTVDVPVTARRVYAILDESYCGLAHSISCGLAVLAPDLPADPGFGHLLKNPYLGASAESAAISRDHDNGAEPYLPPIPIPAFAEALVVVPPPLHEPFTDRTYEKAPFMEIAPAFRARLSTGVLAVPTATGLVYLVDLARWELLSDLYALRTTSSEVGIRDYFMGSTALPQIGFLLHDDSTGQPTSGLFVLESGQAGAKGALVRDPAQPVDPVTHKQLFVPALTLGYTPDEIWSVNYQGFLPGLDEARPAEVEPGPAAGQLRVALQRRLPDGVTLGQIFRVYDPTAAIRVGDIVQLWTSGQGGGVCPNTPASTDADPIEPAEGQVLEIDAPDGAHPGGSLVLGQPFPVVVVDGGFTKQDATARNLWAGCSAALAGAEVPVRIRARGWDPAEGADPANPPQNPHHEFVVAGSTLGYVGRAVENFAADLAVDGQGQPLGTPHDFVLRTRDEATLSCPLLPWSQATAESASCDSKPGPNAACRQRCEDLTVARKARRLWNVSVRCPVGDLVCEPSYPMFAASKDDGTGTGGVVLDTARVIQPTGPVIAFRLGVDYTNKLDPTHQTKLLVRDTLVRFATQSGFRPSTRYGSPISGGTGVRPSAGVAFDRSDPAWNKASDGARLYVPYLDGTVIDTSPSHSNGVTQQLR